jgi:hypothetical protein
MMSFFLKAIAKTAVQRRCRLGTVLQYRPALTHVSQGSRRAKREVRQEYPRCSAVASARSPQQNRQGFCRRRCGKRNAIFSPLLWLIGEYESTLDAPKARWNVKGGSQVGGLFWARPTESYAALDLDSRPVRYQTDKSLDAVT